MHALHDIMGEGSCPIVVLARDDRDEEVLALGKDDRDEGDLVLAKADLDEEELVLGKDDLDEEALGRDELDEVAVNREGDVTETVEDGMVKDVDFVFSFPCLLSVA